MPDDGKDLCPECANPNCICFAFGFGMPDNEVKKYPLSHKDGEPEHQQIVPEKYDLC